LKVEIDNIINSSVSRDTPISTYSRQTKEVYMSSNTIYHTHHIIPRYMGGSDDPSNLVKLTIEEHAEAHRKLYEEHGRTQDKLAWKALLGQSKSAEWISERSRLGGQKSSTKGIPKSIEHKKRISESKKGKARPEFSGNKHPMFGSKEQSNRANKLNDTILTCPHCRHTQKNVGNMNRWHFDNCKYK